MLKQWKLDNNITWDEMARGLGITRRGLINIVIDKSPKTKVITCLKIKQLTGLEPWEYLDNLDAFKKLFTK